MMRQRTLVMSNSKQMLRALLVFSFPMIIVITYSLSGFMNDNIVDFLQIPTRNSTNFNKPVYKHKINESFVERGSSTDLLLLVNKSSAEISKHRTKSINKQDIMSNKTYSDGERYSVNLEKYRRTLLQRKLYDKTHEHWLYLQSSRGHFNKSAYDIMSTSPITFDNAYTNPCWRGDGRNEFFNDGNLHCLPYFYLVGVKKSGTSDFMSRISQHPDYCKAPEKELQWLSRRRFGVRVPPGMISRFSRLGYDIRKVEAFSSILDTTTKCISSPSPKEHTPVTYRRVVADGSPSNFHMHTKWELLPGNENLTEPRFTNFHYIKHLTPDVKIIVLFRDPTTRLYSDFWQTTKGRYGLASPIAFHDEVLKLIGAYKRCFSHSTERSCVYNNTLKKKLLQESIELHGSFNAGFYAVFMEDMLSAFGKDRILPIFMPDYITKMEETLRSVFSFLDMADVSDGTMFKMLNSRTKNAGENKFTIKPMLNATRKILYDFFKPYNERMATLMNDSRYLFPRT